MSEVQFQEFDRRVNAIHHRRKKLAKGYRVAVDRNNLLVAKPTRRGFEFPFVGVMVLAVCLVLIKAILFSSLGEATYSERVAKLKEGTVVEQVGAFVMTPEPLTMWIVGQIQPYVKS